MICAGNKTKLLVLRTFQLKKRKLEGQPKLEIVVCGNKAVETKSERLLGLVVNNTLTWSHYIHGEEKRIIQGLLFNSQRVGLLR